MEKISFKNKTFKKETAPKYEFQEVCLELSKLSGLKTGVCFALWKKRGWEIRNILAEIKAGEIKNPGVYIKHLLKNN